MNASVQKLNDDVPVTILRPRGALVRGAIAELWEFRGLVWAFASRDIRVRYRQTLLGAVWAVIQPLTAMVVFTLFFGKLAKLPSDGLPYPLFAFAALVPWGYFSQALTSASGSIVSHGAMIGKIYFPRLVLPVVPLLSGLVDFGVALAVLGALMAWFGVAPGLAALALPAFLLLATASALAVGVWLAALNAYYRDFRYVIPFLLQIWLFATPIVYPSSMLPEKWRALYGLNPMASVVEGFRWGLLGAGSPPGPMLAISSAAVLVLLAGGIVFFRRMERTLADIV